MNDIYAERQIIINRLPDFLRDENCDYLDKLYDGIKNKIKGVHEDLLASLGHKTNIQDYRNDPLFKESIEYSKPELSKRDHLVISATTDVFFGMIIERMSQRTITANVYEKDEKDEKD
jgi:hypothetical protein